MTHSLEQAPDIRALTDLELEGVSGGFLKQYVQEAVNRITTALKPCEGGAQGTVDLPDGLKRPCQLPG